MSLVAHRDGWGAGGSCLPQTAVLGVIAVLAAEVAARDAKNVRKVRIEIPEGHRVPIDDEPEGGDPPILGVTRGVILSANVHCQGPCASPKLRCDLNCIRLPSSSPSTFVPCEQR